MTLTEAIPRLSEGLTECPTCGTLYCYVCCSECPGCSPYAPMAKEIGVVATAFGLGMDALIQRGRSANVVRARHLAMYVLYRGNGHTLAKIGEALGGRSPAAVSHGFQIIAWRLTFDTYLQSKLSEIWERLGNS